MLLVRVVFIFLKLVLLEAVCLGRTVRAIATFISLLVQNVSYSCC